MAQRRPPAPRPRAKPPPAAGDVGAGAGSGVPGAWEWRLALRIEGKTTFGPFGGYATSLGEGGRSLVSRLFVESHEATEDIPPLMLQGDLPGVELTLSSSALQARTGRANASAHDLAGASSATAANAASNANANNPANAAANAACATGGAAEPGARQAAQAEELMHFSLRSARLRWVGLGGRYGWRLRLRSRLAVDTHDFDDLSRVTLLRETEIRLAVGSSPGRKGLASGERALSLALEGERLELHVSPAAVHLACVLANCGLRSLPAPRASLTSTTSDEMIRVGNAGGGVVESGREAGRSRASSASSSASNSQNAKLASTSAPSQQRAPRERTQSAEAASMPSAPPIGSAASNTAVGAGLKASSGARPGMGLPTVHAVNHIHNELPIDLLLGQVGTSEEVVLAADSTLAYAWRLPPKSSPANPATATAASAVAAAAASPTHRLHFRLANFRLASSQPSRAHDSHAALWSDAIDLDAPQRRWLPVGPDEDHVLALLTVSVRGFMRVVTLSPSHYVANELPTPMRAVVLRDGMRSGSMLVPAGCNPQPLLLRFSRTAHRVHTLVLSSASAAVAEPPLASQVAAEGHGSSTVLPVPAPPLLPSTALVAAELTASSSQPSAADGGGARLAEGIKFRQLVQTNAHSTDASETGTPSTGIADTSAFWYSAVRAEGSYETHLVLSAPLLLANTSAALPLHYRCELLTDGEAWSSILSAADSGTVEAGGEAPLCLTPHATRSLNLRLRIEGYSWCSPALSLDAQMVDRIRQGMPLTTAVHATNRYGQRTELHVVVQEAAVGSGARGVHGTGTTSRTGAGASRGQGEAGAANGRASESEGIDRAGDGSQNKASRSAAFAANSEAASTLAIASGPSLVIALLAPFEVCNTSGATLALQCSLDRNLTLLIPPSVPDAPLSEQYLLGSWGQRDEYDPERKYLLRLACAADVEDTKATAAGPLTTNPEGGALRWSPFVTSADAAPLVLPAEMGEALQVALSSSTRLASSRLPYCKLRSLSLQPGAAVYNLTRWPLRLAACGFPFFRRLSPLAGPNNGVELLRWQCDETADDFDASGERRSGALTSVTLCIDPILRTVNDSSQGAHPCDGGEACEPSIGRSKLAVKGERDTASGSGVDSEGAVVQEQKVKQEGEEEDDDEEPVEWLWSREICLGAAKVGWRQRVVLASECGQLALVAVDLIVDTASGVRKVLIQHEEQPPLRLHNLTPYDLYVSEATAAASGEGEGGEPLEGGGLWWARTDDPPLKLAAGAQGPYCSASVLDERLSHATLSSAARAGGGADALSVSRHSSPCSSGGAAVAFALSPPRVLLLAPTTASGDGHARTPIARTAICQQGPTCLVVFLPITTPGVDGDHHSSLVPPPPPPPPLSRPPTPPRDLSFAAGFGEVAMIFWDERRPPMDIGASGIATPLLHARLLACTIRAERHSQPPPLPASLQGGTQRLPAPRASTLSFCTRALQLDGWPVRGQGRPSKVVLSAQPPPLHSAAHAPALPPQLRMSILAVQPSPDAPRYVQLLELRAAPLEASLDDALIARLRLYAADVARCHRITASRHAVDVRTAQAEAASESAWHSRKGCSSEGVLAASSLDNSPSSSPPRSPSSSATPSSLPQFGASTETSAQGPAADHQAERAARTSSPVAAPDQGAQQHPDATSIIYIERLEIGEIDLALTAHTSQLAPMHVAADRAPLTFASLAVGSLRGSAGALGRALLSRYGSDALAASPALLGSLQLLGNPTWLLRSVRAGLSDALALPLAGARQGPKQFVVGLGAGTSSLFKHVSHGALTSVSDFATAVANNIRSDGAGSGVDGSLPSSGADDLEGLTYVGSHRAGADGLATAGIVVPQPSRSRLRGVRRGLYGAVSRPAAGALQLVSAASQSLIQTVGIYAPPTPAPLPSGLPLARRASIAWCERALAKNSPGEVYLCHCPAFPVLGDNAAGGGTDDDEGGYDDGGDADNGKAAGVSTYTPAAAHELLLSSGGLYLLRDRRMVLALPSRFIERLEAPPPQPTSAGAAGSSLAATASRRVLAVFISPFEASRLGIPSCLQYVVPAHAAHRFLALFDVELAVYTPSSF